jgi:hypothetical protein
MENKVYDKAKWHYDAKSFPADLPRENGGTHIAFFLRWCIENDFISKDFFEEEDDFIKMQQIKDGKLDCRQFFIDWLDGVLCSEMLNAKGAKFANAYYHSDRTKFAKIYGYYCSDVDDWAQSQQELFTKGKNDAYYYIENDEKTYLIFKELIDRRYNEFLQMNKK